MNFFYFVKALYRYILPYKWKFLLIFLCTIFGLTYEVSLRYSLKFIIDEIIQNGKSFYILFVLIMIGGIVYTVLGILSDYLWAKYGTVVTNNLSSDLLMHLQYLPLNSINKFKIGDVISRFNTDIKVIENGLVYAVPAAVVSFGGIIFSAYLLFELNVYLFLTSVAGILLSALSPRLIHKKTAEANYETHKYIGSITGFLNEILSSQLLIKVYGLKNYSNTKFKNKLDEFLKLATSAYFLSYLSMRLPNLIFLFSNITVLGLGVWLTMEKKMSIGSLASYQILFLSLSGYVESMTYFIPSFVSSRASIARLNEIFDEKNPIVEKENAISISNFNEKIEFQKVSFGYNPNKSDLNSLSFEIQKKKFSVFMGHSGAGKTSIINLILRLYEIDSGELWIDGHKIQDLSISSLRQQIGYVSQHIILFNLTIEENISLGKLDATKNEIMEAAENADIHDFIMSLPEGYQTLCGENGNRFSGGERQKIALARALIRKPSILILDEATSALDPISEQSIISTLHKLKKDFTIIAITHKVNLAMEADIIFVVEGGRIMEKGSPSELISKGGIFEQFLQTQG